MVRHLQFLTASDCLIAFQLKDLEGIFICFFFFVVFNGNRDTKTVDIPEGEYRVACCNGVISEAGIGMPVSGGKTTVDGQSALILYRQELHLI